MVLFSTQLCSLISFKLKLSLKECPSTTVISNNNCNLFYKYPDNLFSGFSASLEETQESKLQKYGIFTIMHASTLKINLSLKTKGVKRKRKRIPHLNMSQEKLLH